MNSKGFTLIELIVTIAIILVVTGGGIAAFINFNDRQNVQVAAKDLQTLLRAAQIKARVGEDAGYCRTTYGEILRGYRVYIVDGTSTAILSASCAADKFTPSASRHYVEREESRINFDSNVTASMQGGGDVDMEFLTLLGGVDGVGTIEITGLSDVFTFDITAGGEIKEGAFE